MIDSSAETLVANQRKMYNPYHLKRLVSNKIGQPISSAEESLKIAINLPIGDLRDLHDSLSLSMWNSEPTNIESRDIMANSFGGIMYGSPRFYKLDEPLRDIVSQKVIVDKTETKIGHSSMHLMPIGRAHKVSGLEVPVSSLIILDFKRLINSLDSKESKGTNPDVFTFDTNYHMARYLQKNFGFFVEKIFDDYKVLPPVFDGWEEIKKIEKPTIRMFITKKELLGLVKEKVERAHSKLVEFVVKEGISIDDYETRLRRFAISAFAYFGQASTEESLVKLYSEISQ